MTKIKIITTTFEYLNCSLFISGYFYLNSQSFGASAYTIVFTNAYTFRVGNTHQRTIISVDGTSLKLEGRRWFVSGVSTKYEPNAVICTITKIYHNIE